MEAAKTAILVKRNVTFLAIKLRKSYVGVEFRLEREVSADQIVKVTQISPGAFYYALKIKSLSEVDDSIRNWVCEAYKDAK